jgi:transcriptional regulator with PAS, ATPase and Fis domain
LSPSAVIDTDSLPPEILAYSSKSGLKEVVSKGKTLKENLDEVERNVISEALKDNVTLQEAANKLKIDLSTLVRKIDKHSLPKRYKINHVHVK